NVCSYYNLYVPVSLTDQIFWLSIGVNSFVVLFGVGLYRYTTKKIFWCFLWIFLNLFPIIILIPFRHFFSSRYLYIPSIGLCLLLAVGFNYVFITLKSSLMKNLVKIFLIFIFVWCSVRIIKENFNRRDAITRDVILCKKYPDDFRLRFDLAWDYQCKGLYDDAIREYKKSLQLNPYFESTRINLGHIYMKKALYNQAINEYRKVLKIVPDNDVVHNNLGLCYTKLNLYDKAIEEYELAIKVNSEFIAPYKNLGTIYAIQGLYNEAIEKYKKSLELDPTRIKIRINLGYIYGLAGKNTLAMNEYKKVLKLEPGNIFVKEKLEELKNLNIIKEE
ncbi:tetratricopeptide repeat protein, partial [bacterium]|nr:tetratricopeptide repeat protein [bacterium]